MTDDPDKYSGVASPISRDSWEQFDDLFQFAMPLIVGNAFASTDYNITCALEYYENPAGWEQMMQDLEAQTGLTADEVYANYDARFVYETLGLDYSGFAEEVISMISPDEETYAVRLNDDGTYSRITYTFDRT